MIASFPIDYPYALSLGQLWVRYLLAGSVYLLLGAGLWIVLHGFIFGKSLKALTGGLLLGVAMIFWPLGLLPYLRFIKFPVYLILTAAAAGILLFLDRYLWKRVRSINPEERKIARRMVPLLVVIMVLGTFIFAWLENSSDRNSYQETSTKLEEAQSQLAEIQQEAATVTAQMAQDPAFRKLFKNGNYSALNPLAQKEINTAQLIDAVAITDQNGITVAAPHNPLLVNQDLTVLGPAHVRVLGGEPSKTLELGITTPLVVGAGTPLLENGEVIGAVFAAKLIDRAFVAALAQQIGVENLGIYCNCNKLYVSTISNSQFDKAVQNFAKLAFNEENVAENKSFIQNLTTEGVTLTAAGQILTDENGQKLALLMVFSPYPPKELLWSLKATTVLTTGITILLFFSPLVIHRLKE